MLVKPKKKNYSTSETELRVIPNGTLFSELDCVNIATELFPGAASTQDAL
jgi:hypothetical protein